MFTNTADISQQYKQIYKQTKPNKIIQPEQINSNMNKIIQR